MRNVFPKGSEIATGCYECLCYELQGNLIFDRKSLRFLTESQQWFEIDTTVFEMGTQCSSYTHDWRKDVGQSCVFIQKNAGAKLRSY